MANHADGEASYEFWLESKIDKILGLGAVQDLLRRFQWALLGGEPYHGFPQPLADNFFQAAKRATDNEKDVLGVDGGRRFAAPLVEVHHGLNLARDVIGRSSWDFGLLHEL